MILLQQKGERNEKLHVFCLSSVCIMGALQNCCTNSDDLATNFPSKSTYKQRINVNTNTDGYKVLNEDTSTYHPQINGSHSQSVQPITPITTNDVPQSESTNQRKPNKTKKFKTVSIPTPLPSVKFMVATRFTTSNSFLCTRFG